MAFPKCFGKQMLVTVKVIYFLKNLFIESWKSLWCHDGHNEVEYIFIST